MKHAQRKLKAIIATLGVALVVCFVALIGMSFAWFVQSDSFTSSISVGNVDLEVNARSVNDTAVLSFDNAQPGGLYAGYFSVTSDGGFAYSCSLSVEIPEGGDTEGLADMLEVYIVPLGNAESEVSYNDVKDEYYVGILSALDGVGYTFTGGIAGQTKYYAVVIVFDTAATNEYASNDERDVSVTFQMSITATQVGYIE